GPAEAFGEGLQLGRRRARDGGERDVALTQMGGDAVEVVGPERAVLADDLAFRCEHEVVDDELASLAEELRQRLSAVRPVERVVLVDAQPRERAALRAELV